MSFLFSNKINTEILFLFLPFCPIIESVVISIKGGKVYNSISIIKRLEDVFSSLDSIIQDLIISTSNQTPVACESACGGNFIMYFTIFMLACFVGYYVIWKVTPSLHAPLMSITNAISSVIIVGAIIAVGQEYFPGAGVFGFFAVLLAAVNIFGGFMVTYRMLAMFKNSK